MKRHRHFKGIRGTAAALLIAASSAMAQTPLGTAFTYQGELRQSGSPATGAADLRFRLYSAVSAGSQIGSEVVLNGTALSAGRFTGSLDFGAAAFGPDARWLEIDVRFPAGSGSFVTLTPRQRVTPAPAARYAADAAQLNGQGASFYQNASNLTGTLPSGVLSGPYSGAVTFGNASNAFSGAGSGLTALNAANVGSGTLADARLSGNVALLSGVQTFSGTKTFSAAPAFTAAGSPFSVSGAGLVANLNADRLDGLDSSAFLQSIPSPLNLSGSQPGAIVRGSNSSTSNGSSGIFGESMGSSFSYGVYGRHTSNLGRGVYGVSPGAGVFGESSGDMGTGVVAMALSTTGLTFGLFAVNYSSGGSGVWGEALASTGETYGVVGKSSSTGGVGIAGVAEAPSGTTYGGVFRATSGTGAYGVTNGNGYGLHGVLIAPSGWGNGPFGAPAILGETNVTNGVLGVTSATLAAGTCGYAPDGFGVYGITEGRTGVRGLANSSIGTNYGTVGATNSLALGWGVYCYGDLGATGNKLFRIDHPLDPENKYLLHYCTEGAEPLNVYSGNVTTDADGYATVELPVYAEAINRDFRYQLTVLDEDDQAGFVLAKVVRKVRDNSFVIRTSGVNVEVSWRVEGIRNDPYTRAYRKPAEMDKPESERGRYQHPELYGQPPERGELFHPLPLPAAADRPKE